MVSLTSTFIKFLFLVRVFCKSLYVLGKNANFTTFQNMAKNKEKKEKLKVVVRRHKTRQLE